MTTFWSITRDFVLVIIVVCGLAVPALAQADVFVTLPDVTGEVGEIVEVDVAVGDLTGLDVSGYSFSLLYDAAFVSGIEAEGAGTISGEAGLLVIDNPGGGNFRVAAAGSEAMSGAGTLITLRFEILQEGTTTLQWNSEREDGGFSFDVTSVTVDLSDGGSIEGTTNQPPQPSPDAYDVDEDNSLSVNAANGVLANDTDPDGDPITASIDTDVSVGDLDLASDGSFSYTPPLDFDGDVSFTYSASDGNGGINSATVTIDIIPVNDPPVAVADAAQAQEDGSVAVDVLGNDTDVEGDPLSVTSVTNPSNGSASINGTGTVTYTPDDDYNGENSFSYTVSDGNGGTDVGTVTVTVTPVNDDPVAVDDSEQTNEDTPVEIDVLANDSDVDGDELTVASLTQPPNGTAVNDGDGTVTYTPEENYEGTDSFTYTVSDGNGGTGTASVSVTVGGINDFPVAADDIGETEEDTPVVLNVLANDTDEDGDPLTVELVNQPSNGSAVINGGETVTYTPDENYNGEDSFTYTVSDGNGGTDTGTVTVTVIPVNDAPEFESSPVTSVQEGQLYVYNIAASDVDGDALAFSGSGPPSWLQLSDNGGGSATLTGTPSFGDAGTYPITLTVDDGTLEVDQSFTITVGDVNQDPDAVDDAALTDEDVPVSINVLENDSDADGDVLSVMSVTNPPNGSASINGNGTVTYEPDENYNGEDSFTYTVGDGNGGTDDATVTVTIAPINDNPVAVDDARTTPEDMAATINVVGNDSDVDGDMLSVANATGAASGSVVINGDGTVTYTPDANYNGSDSFSYTVSDGNGGSDQGAVSITVSPRPDPPVAPDISEETDEDTAVTIAVEASDVDGDEVFVSNVGSPDHGTAAITGGLTIEYEPDQNYNGPDSFTYTVSDGNGGTDTGTVTVTVTPVNDDPVAVDDSEQTVEDTPVVIDVLANDTDVDGDDLAVESVTQPQNGSATMNGTTVTYTPDANYDGSDSFTYTVSDGNGGTDDATVTVVVGDVISPPVAVDDSAETDEDTPVIIEVLANDSDEDGDPLTVAEVTVPPNGEAVISGDGSTVVYTPDEDYNGEDSFIYSVSDGTFTRQATVSVDVSPINDTPDPLDDEASTDEDVPVVIDVLANDSDVDGDVLTIDNCTQPDHGTVDCTGGIIRGRVVGERVQSVNVVGGTRTSALEPVTDGQTLSLGGGGMITYTPDPDWNSGDSAENPDTFTYTVSDGNGGIATATVSVFVTPVNDGPVAQDDSGQTNEETPIEIDVLANDSDVDGDDLAVKSLTQPQNGSANTNGATVTYTPDAGFDGTDSFTYTASDGNGGTDVATVTIDVDDIPCEVVARDDVASTPQNQSVVIHILSNDTTCGGVEIVLSGDPVGLVAVNADGTVTYVPAADFIGEDTFTYDISDENGSDGAQVTIVVGGDPPPVAIDDEAETEEDAPVTINILANDSDPDGDALTVESVTQPPNGTVVNNEDGTVTYTPDEDTNSGDEGDDPDIFTYTVSDGNGGTDQATVTVTVMPVNDAPSASTITDPEDGSDVIVVSAITVAWTESEDVDSEALSYTWQASLSEGDFGDPVLSIQTDELSAELSFETLDSLFDDAGVAVGESIPVYHRVVATDGRLSTVGPVATVILERGEITDAEGQVTPAEFAIVGVYPNPTSTHSTVDFDLAEGSEVTLEVYDVLGRLVLRRDAGTLPAGAGHSIGVPAAAFGAGTYLYRLEAAGARTTEVESGRFTIVR